MKKVMAAVLAALMVMSLSVCAGAEEDTEAEVGEEAGVQLGMVYEAAHGTSCFTIAIAAVSDDTVIDAYVDDFQFLTADDVEGVPNSDAGFGESYAEDMALASKRENSDYYSSVMAENGGATVSYIDNITAVCDYAKGKTIDELESVAGTGEEAVDTVSGATLEDTANYLLAIADAAKAAQENEQAEYAGDPESLKLGVIYTAAHGDKCFTIAAALSDGDTIVLGYVDELQFMDAEEVEGVPNSDEGFGSNVAEGYVLASKRVNSDYYFGNMSAAGATVPYADNMDAIQTYVAGMSLDDAEALAAEGEDAVDTVTGATLEDTANYVEALKEAAEQ